MAARTAATGGGKTPIVVVTVFGGHHRGPMTYPPRPGLPAAVAALLLASA